MSVPSNATTIYNLLPLEKEKKEIRLLALTFIHGKDINTVEPLRCEMIKASLTDPPNYNALSYTWGEPIFSKTLLVKVDDGLSSTSVEIEVPVTESLYSALIHLRTACATQKLPFRQKDGSLEQRVVSNLFWADAICINQTDPVEKSWQVNMMKEVYVCATQVAAWLGGAEMQPGIPELIYTLFECWSRGMSLFGRQAILPLSFAQYIDDSSTPRTVVIEKDREKWYRDSIWIQKGHASGITPAGVFVIGFDALRWLIYRPFWQRVWIFQEICLGERVSFFCGGSMIPSKVLHDVLYICSQAFELGGVAGLTKPGGRRHNDTFGPLSLTWKYTDESKGLFDLFVAALGYGFAASDPRDYVFALLGLIDDANDAPPIEADYSMTCEDVYIKVTRYFIASRGLQVLSWCRFPKVQNNLPSWVPDYSNMVTTSKHPTIWKIVAESNRRLFAPFQILIPVPNYPPSKRNIPGISEQSIHAHTEHLQTENPHNLDGLILTQQALLVDNIKEILPHIWSPKGPWSKYDRVPRLWHYQIRFRYLARRIKSQARMYDEKHIHKAIAFTSVCGGSDRGRDERDTSSSSMAYFEECYNALLAYSPLCRSYKHVPRAGHHIGSMERKAIIEGVIRAGYTGYPSQDAPSAYTSSEQHFKFIGDGNLLSPDLSFRLPFASCLNYLIYCLTNEGFPATIELPEHFIERFDKICGLGEGVGRRFCLTEKGYIGMVPRHTAPNDVVSLLHKGYTPFILSPKEQSAACSRRTFSLVGESYFHGMMDREPRGLKFDPRLHFIGPSVEAETTSQPVPSGEIAVIDLV